VNPAGNFAYNILLKPEASTSLRVKAKLIDPDQSFGSVQDQPNVIFISLLNVRRKTHV
jgi:hypothetical protein